MASRGWIDTLLFFNRNKNDAIRWFANVWIANLLRGLDTAGNRARRDEGLRSGATAVCSSSKTTIGYPLIGARYQLGVDGLALSAGDADDLLGVVSVVCSWAYIREKGREKEYYIMLLLLQSGMLGAFVSADLFLFFVFWEVMLVPMYFLIGIWGGKNRLYSAIKFFLYTLVGSVVMLLAVLKLFFIFPDVVQGKNGRRRSHRPPARCEQPRRSASDSGRSMSEMLNLALDAMKRVEGNTDSRSIEVASSRLRHSSFNIAAMTAIGPHIKAVFGIGL